MSRSTSDPFREAPTRQAGQSIRERRDDLLGDAQPWIAVAVMAGAWAGLEWVSWLARFPRQPLVFTFVAVVVVVLALLKLQPIVQELRNLSLGERGERRVSDLLEDLKSDGYYAIHDLPGEGFNIDHVLVGPTGIFAVETKTRSKGPDRRDARASVVGERILFDGHALDRDPIAQAKLAARDVAEIVFQRTGLRIQVKPAVVLPGWFVDPEGRGEVWVLNAERFLGYVRHERANELSVEQVSRVRVALLEQQRAASARSAIR